MAMPPRYPATVGSVPVRPFRFGQQLMDWSDPDAVAVAARRAEELGYDDLWSYDHVGTVDPFAPLLVAAAATTTLRVGPLVLNNELHHPALLARTAATVDRMTGGRLVLGLGTGYQQSEHDAIGLELRPPGARVDRFGESLQVLRSLLDDGAVTFDGEHHHLAVDRLGVRPAQARVPFLIGGHGRRVVGLAGRFADVFQFTGLTHGPGGVPQPGGFDEAAVATRARWLEEAAGDRVDAIERSALVQALAVGEGAASAAAEASASLGLSAEEVAGSPFVLFGSVEQLVDELERRRERLGISHVVVRDAEAFAPVVAALRGR
jgi:probable F420-dependent oxidoreductase